MRTIVLISAISLVTASCMPPRNRPGTPSAAARTLPPTIRVQVRDRGALIVLAVPTEEYVAATILSEVDPPTADERVLERMYEVQAVVSRTYAVAERGRHAREGYDVCATTHCQLYEPSRLRSSKWADVVRRATRQTEGRILWFGDAPARVAYHADCGGHTSNARDVWGGEPLPYLAGVADGGAARRAHATWTFETSRARLRAALNGDPRTTIGAELRQIEIDAQDGAGRAERIRISGTRTLTIRGEIFRDVLSRAFGVNSLRSTLFTMTASGEKFLFSGRGFGHGVGLCQTGAFARLRAGASVRPVLSHYFPGTRLSNR